MKNCKIAVFYSSQQAVILEEVAIPVLKPGEILVKNEYTTLCRSDLNTYCGKRSEKTPTILGHEIVGRIVAFGEEAIRFDLRNKSLELQDRITWGIYASDPDSEMSRSGMPQKGADLFKYGHEQITETSTLHGGLGEYILLRANTPMIKIDEQIPVQIAALINCSIATVAGAIRIAGDLQGKKVLISGVGMLGTIACAMAKANDAAQVCAMDVDPKRLATALRFGADSTILSSETPAMLPNEKFNVLIELSGVASAMEKTLDMLSIGGVAVWIGATYPERDIQINAEKVVRNLLTIKGLHNYNQDDLTHAVEFIEKYYTQYPFESMVYDHFGLDEVNEAFAYALDKNPFRVGVRIDG
ncbi:MAG: zinc-binding dehydrogenase [Microscillaceae bacterium]|nr:zinc-binding dehydrogenase [Microscillaceae bacterium]